LLPPDALLSYFLKKVLLNPVKNSSLIENQKLLNETLFGNNSIDTEIVFVIVTEIQVNINWKYELLLIQCKLSSIDSDIARMHFSKEILYKELMVVGLNLWHECFYFIDILYFIFLIVKELPMFDVQFVLQITISV